MRRAGVVLALAVLAAPTAGAQRIGAGAGVAYAFADYVEQGPSLRFAGRGIAAQASLDWRRLSLHLGVTRAAFEPESAPAEGFDMLQADARLRWRVSRLASVEAGWVQRDVEPLHAAQSVGALRLGAVAAFPIASGSEISLRSSWLGASRFSGGGAAPFGVEVGLGMRYAPWSGRVRVTGDLEFQRFDRRTTSPAGRLDAPIESTMARLGVMLVR